jgi:hypothetical protein
VAATTPDGFREPSVATWPSRETAPLAALSVGSVEAIAENLGRHGYEDEEQAQPHRRTPAVPVADEICGVRPVVRVVVDLFGCTETHLNLHLFVFGPGSPTSLGKPRLVRTACRRAGEEPVEFVAGLVAPGIREPLQLAQVTLGHRARGQKRPRTNAAFVEQVVQLGEVLALIREVGQPVQSHLVALVGQCSQGLSISVHVGHAAHVATLPQG